MQNTGKITFDGAHGQKLAARLDMPDGEPIAYALFAHCFTCTKDIFAAARIADELKKQGFAILRFDFTGLGASEGDFANTNFTSNVQDLIAAANFLRKDHKAPALLIGHSLGGSAILASAKDIPEARGVVTIGSPADVAHVAHNFGNAIDEIMEKGEAEVCLVGRPFRIKREFIEDIRGFKLDEHIKNLGKALLVMHAPLDQTVGIENAGHIFTQAKHPKSFISLHGADHIISKKEDAQYIGQVVSMWIKRYL